jgi:thioredoxin 2
MENPMIVVETPAAALNALNVVCPHCHATNRVPEEPLADAPACGACKHPLFEGHPAALTGEQFERHIAGSDLPVVVDFWAPWCAPCRMMAPVFERAARELEPHARFAKVNTDEEHALAMERDIRGIPTLAIFKEGRELARVAGLMEPAGFLAWVRSHLRAGERHSRV